MPSLFASSGASRRDGKPSEESTAEADSTRGQRAVIAAPRSRSTSAGSSPPPSSAEEGAEALNAASPAYLARAHGRAEHDNPSPMPRLAEFDCHSPLIVRSSPADPPPLGTSCSTSVGSSPLRSGEEGGADALNSASPVYLARMENDGPAPLTMQQEFDSPLSLFPEQSHFASPLSVSFKSSLIDPEVWRPPSLDDGRAKGNHLLGLLQGGGAMHKAVPLQPSLADCLGVAAATQRGDSAWPTGEAASAGGDVLWSAIEGMLEASPSCGARQAPAAQTPPGQAHGGGSIGAAERSPAKEAKGPVLLLAEALGPRSTSTPAAVATPPKAPATSPEPVKVTSSPIAAKKAPASTTPVREAATPVGDGQVLRLAEVLREPELGSPEMPTAGSAGHKLGTCKPCAFVHTKGCTNGTQCQFCHICDQSELWRRKKEKLALRHRAKSGGAGSSPGAGAAPPPQVAPLLSGLTLLPIPGHIPGDFVHQD
mmetsp:Transcript_104600/g.223568  ORF Transcript_104600/g.223568 Transcript_104600/m.223568 type:complete len:482 (-) Transcript_104600:200-1645(-)